MYVSSFMGLCSLTIDLYTLFYVACLTHSRYTTFGCTWLNVFAYSCCWHSGFILFMRLHRLEVFSFAVCFAGSADPNHEAFLRCCWCVESTLNSDRESFSIVSSSGRSNNLHISWDSVTEVSNGLQKRTFHHLRQNVREFCSCSCKNAASDDTPCIVGQF